MRFSEHFGISTDGSTEWFDPLLDQDTRLFIDPFLIFDDADQYWTKSHTELIGFFNSILKLLAKSGFKPGVRLTKAKSLLLFPEPEEFCLGYSETGTAGSGSGGGLRSTMLDGAQAAIARGVESVSHFEELMLFGGGIGADRIGDIVGNVLKSRFIEYTQRVCQEFGVPLETVRVEHVRWDAEHLRWVNDAAQLPVNPFNRKGVLLTPRRFLARLPTVDPSDFWDWAWHNENETIRNDFNYEIGSNADAEEIVRFARRHPDFVARYIEWREQEGASAYDSVSDPALEVRWYDYGRHLAQSVGPAPDSPEEFEAKVLAMLEAFKHWVEQEGGWEALWNQDRTKRVAERNIQLVFRATVKFACRAWDIDISGEVDAGRGPVDFKFSRGWTARALVEIKPMDNPRYKHGVRSQLPTYLESEEVFVGYFVAIAFTDAEGSDERRGTIQTLASQATQTLGRQVRPFFIDARPKPSATKS